MPFVSSKAVPRYLNQLEEIRTKEGVAPTEVHGLLSKSDIRGMRRVIGAYSTTSWSERNQLLRKVNEVVWQDAYNGDAPNWFRHLSPIGITESHTVDGLYWLKHNIQRWEREAKTKHRLESDFCAFVRDVRDVLGEDGYGANFKEFRFGGFTDAAQDTTINARYGIITPVPIFQIVTQAGNKFAYAYSSWQSGIPLMFNPPFERCWE